MSTHTRPLQHPESEHTITPRGYILVFLVLLVLLALTVAVAYLDWGVWSMILALLIASTKALQQPPHLDLRGGRLYLAGHLDCVDA